MKKFKLILTRSLTLTLLAVLTSTVLKAQSLPPTGTANEYEISSAADWKKFADDVNSGVTYKGKTIVLKANIPTAAEIAEGTTALTDMVGTAEYPFKGKFKGNSHTITVSYTSNGTTFVAPFAYTNGAEINKLSVAGAIEATAGKAAGVIGCNIDNTTKINGGGTISVNITGGGDYCAGVVGDGTTSVEISSCVYNGKIVAGSNSAGFYAIGCSSGSKIFNSLFSPAAESSISSGATFVNGTFDKNSKNYYYTSLAGTTEQGVHAYQSYATAPNESPFTQCKQIYGDNYCYAEGTGTLTGVKSEYYLSTILGGGFLYSVTFKNAFNSTITLTEGDDYTDTIYNSSHEPVSITSTTPPGSYTLEITGKEGHYKGKLTASFTINESFVANGAGTEAHPYEISDTTEWKNFAREVNNGHSFSGEFLKLTNNITVKVPRGNTDKMVGVYVADNNFKPFSGTFDGNWKKLRFYGGESTTGNHYDKVYCAPFRCINGATFKNIDIEGTIETDTWRASGLVGSANGTNYITNCNSSIIINKYSNDNNAQIESGGFVARAEDGTVYFSNCIFDGEINDKNKNEKCAGFIGWTQVLTHYNTCYMAGTLCTSKSKKASNFQRNNKIAKDTVAMYYTKNYNISLTTDQYQGPRGNLASKTFKDSTGLFKKYTVDDNIFYIPGEITPLKNMVYVADFDDVETNFFGKRFVKDKDYTVTIEHKEDIEDEYELDTVVTSSGYYRVTVTGKGNCVGLKVFEFRMIPDNWQTLVDAIANAANGDTIKLSHEYVAMSGDNALVIPAGKTLTIDLNNYFIDRNLTEAVKYGQVFRIEAGAKLTIIGPGEITGGFNKAVDKINDDNDTGAVKNDAGGIYNMGDLTLKNVTVINNKCIKTPDEATNASATARGGGIYTGAGSSFTMIGGKVIDNVSRGGGGGVYCFHPSSFSMTGVLIDGNKSESKGGGLRIRTESPVEAYLNHCTVSNNCATETNLTRSSDGGGVFMQEGLLRMDTCTIGGYHIVPPADTIIRDGNKSAFAGAGFYQGGGTTHAKGCTISYNSAYTEHDKMYGGGICVYSGSYYMDDGVITGNHSYRDGGGVFVYQGAHFYVQGNVQIDDNFRTRKGAIPEDTDNNVYVSGTAVVTLSGPLATESRIHITGHGIGGVYTSGLEEYATTDNFVTDGKYQLMNTWSDTIHEITLAPYIWYQSGTWGEDTPAPAITQNVRIDRALELEPREIGYADSVEFVNGRIVLKDGAQFVCHANKTGTPVETYVEKSIKAKGDSEYGWHMISLPLNDVHVVDNFEQSTNLASNKYDLLRYDEPHHYWDSYSSHSDTLPDDWATMDKGRGYLYRNSNDITLKLNGTLNIEDVVCNVTVDGHKLTGFNLIGNPYSHTIYKGEGTAIPNGDLLEEGFYILTKDGTWLSKRDNNDSIAVFEGILVKALGNGSITMKNTRAKNAPSRSKYAKNSIVFTVANSKYEDVAYAMFDKGHGLTKIDHMNDDAPLVYIHKEDEGFAVAYVGDNAKKFNLNFKPKTTGIYTLSVKPEGEFSYLHLFDRLTFEDIDLLEQNEYSFVASITDNVDRFVVLVSESDETDDVFVYQNGNDIIVSGEGELQMFDVAGRMVFTKHVNGIETVSKPSQTGVYIFRLVGSEIKTQKIIIK